jgi:hypothetical protein
MHNTEELGVETMSREQKLSRLNRLNDSDV